MTPESLSDTDAKPSPSRKYFSLDFFPASAVYGGGGDKLPEPNDSSFEHFAMVCFIDVSSGEEEVAVIRGRESAFVDKLKMIAKSKGGHPDVTKASLEKLLDRFAESYLRLSPRPAATLIYDDNGFCIECKEQSCRFHQEDTSCINPKPIIFDDCPEDQLCMAYEKDETKE